MDNDVSTHVTMSTQSLRTSCATVFMPTWEQGAIDEMIVTNDTASNVVVVAATVTAGTAATIRR